MGLISGFAGYLAAKFDRAARQAANEAALGKLHAASADKERALARESKAKAFATYVDPIQKLLRNASIAYGFIVTFAYLFFSAHIFPSGLTLGDSLLFVFVAVGFGFVSFVLGFSGLIFWAPVYAGRQFGSAQLMEDPTRDEAQRMGFSLLLGAAAIGMPLLARTLGASWHWPIDHLVPLAMVWLVAFAIGSVFACGWRPRAKWSGDGWAIVIVHTLVVGTMFPLLILESGESFAFLAACFAIAGALLSMSLSSVESLLRSGAALEAEGDGSLPGQADGSKQMAAQRLRRRQSRFAIAFAVVAFLCPLTLDHWFLYGRLSAKVLDSLGLRFDDITVRLTGSALETVRTQRATSDATLSFCDQPDGSALVYPITLLWYGPGSRSLVAFGPASNQFDPRLRNVAPRFEVAASEVQPAQSGTRRCHDIEHDIFFATKAAEAASPSDTARLIEEVAHTTRALYPVAASAPSGERWRLARVLVAGYADDMALPENGNELLAHRRAACVAAHIVDYLQDAKLTPDAAKIVYWEGEGARSPARTCAQQTDHAQQVECNTANRRTRVRLIFECLGADGAPNTTCHVGSSIDPPRAANEPIAARNDVLTASDNPAAHECVGDDPRVAVATGNATRKALAGRATHPDGRHLSQRPQRIGLDAAE